MQSEVLHPGGKATSEGRPVSQSNDQATTHHKQEFKQ